MCTKISENNKENNTGVAELIRSIDQKPLFSFSFLWQAFAILAEVLSSFRLLAWT